MSEKGRERKQRKKGQAIASLKITKLSSFLARLGTFCSGADQSLFIGAFWAGMCLDLDGLKFVKKRQETIQNYFWKKFFLF